MKIVNSHSYTLYNAFSLLRYSLNGLVLLPILVSTRGHPSAKALSLSSLRLPALLPLPVAAFVEGW